MFGISFLELMVICGVALIVLGPERIPEVAAFLGKWTGELKRMSDSVRREFYNSVYVPPEEPEERENTPRTLKAATADQPKELSPGEPDPVKTEEIKEEQSQ